MTMAQTNHTPHPIRLPKTLGYRDIEGLFGMCEAIRSAGGPIVLDGQDVEFIDPLGIAVLGAILEPICDSRSIRIDWLRTDIGSYLARMHVLTRCSIEGVEVRPFVESNCQKSLVELTKLVADYEVDEAADRLSNAIVGGFFSDNQPDKQDRRAKYEYPLKYALRELLLNALSHAKKEGGLGSCVWVAAQYFKSIGSVSVAVVDNGCGILATLRNSPKLRQKTHVGAVFAALEPYVTCNPELNAGLVGETANRGIGLTTTKRIAAATSGRLIVASGDAVISIAPNATISRVLQNGSTWKGVAILMTCQRSKLPSVNVPSLFPDVPTSPELMPQFVD